MSACITRKRRDAHIASEVLTVAFTVPFLWHVAKQPGLDEKVRLGLRAISVGSLLIDGYLLLFAWPKRGL